MVYPHSVFISEGGLAKVYKAYDQQFRHFVAIRKIYALDGFKYSLDSEFKKSIQY